MYRKGVSALILNNENEFLLVNLDSFKESFFAIPGGGLDENETLEQAVYREIEEELSLSKKLLDPLGVSDEPILITFKTIKLNRNGIEYKGSKRYFFAFRYRGNNENIKLALGEVRSYKWVAFGDLKDYLLFDNQLEETINKIKELIPFFEKY
jgi:8-oxo-dGTP pyrophosphatase MutT (NUDIX family)